MFAEKTELWRVPDLGELLLRALEKSNTDRAKYCAYFPPPYLLKLTHIHTNTHHPVTDKGGVGGLPIVLS